MLKKRVYVESSVISYLTARPARVLLKRIKQEATRVWWEQRDRWNLFVSQSVLQEIRDGDPDAARKRVAAVRDLPSLPETDDAQNLAVHLIAAGAIPEKTREDAGHIAIASLNSMDYLATWNQAHIFNPVTLVKMYAEIRKSGHTPPVLVRPDDLLEIKDDE